MHRLAAALLSIAALAGTAAAQSLPNQSLPNQSLPVVGYLGSETAEVFEGRLASFRDGLAAAAFQEGRNLVIDYRWANSDTARLSALATELVARKPAVLAAPGSLAAALAAKKATSTIPVVFETGADPVRSGLVESLNRPGGNVTGIASLNAAVLGKRIELLRDLQPRGNRLGLLVNAANPVNAEGSTREAREAASRLGLELHVFTASREEQFEAAFEAFKAERMDLVVIANETLFNRPLAFARLAARHGLAVAHQAPEFARAGGLLSYGGDVAQSHRLAGFYVGLILKGQPPSDLPVQQVTRIVSVINARTGRALGLELPPHLLARVDEVVD